MVISFSEPKPREQLRSAGAVVTYRPGERARTPRNGAQETWANTGRGEEKLFDVEVRYLEPVGHDLAALFGYSRLSGFRSSAEWENAIVRLHGEVPDSGHLYLVTRGDGQ